MEPGPVTTVSAAGQAAAVQASLPQHKEAVTLSTSTQKVEKQRTKVVTHSLGLLPLCKAASRGDPQAAQGEAHLTRKELRPANNHVRGVGGEKAIKSPPKEVCLACSCRLLCTCVKGLLHPGRGESRRWHSVIRFLLSNTENDLTGLSILKNPASNTI